jgi:hypothetical protein
VSKIHHLSRSELALKVTFASNLGDSTIRSKTAIKRRNNSGCGESKHLKICSRAACLAHQRATGFSNLLLLTELTKTKLKNILKNEKKASSNKELRISIIYQKKL